MHTIFEIADWFLENIENITSKKLQKLVYYAYAWFIVFHNESSEKIEIKFFNELFEAWVHGPICPCLYDRYKAYGSAVINKSKSETVIFSEDELDILYQIKTIYGKYDGDELEYICCKEEPWIKARNGLISYEPSNNIISDKDIFNYYSSRLI